MIVHGSPAEHPRTLLAAARRRHLLATAGLVAGSVVAVAALIGLAVGGSGLLLTVTIFALLGAAAGYGKMAATRPAVAKTAAGVRAEDRVAAELRRLSPAAVGFGLLLGAGGDADVVVAGPCLAAIEVKSGRGEVRAEHGRFTVGGRPLPTDPVGQARRQAAALHRATGRWTAAVVCVVDAAGAPQQFGDVTVCSLADLAGVLRALPRVLGPGEGEQLLEQLVARSAQLEATVGAAPVRTPPRPARGSGPRSGPGQPRQNRR